ncbi:NOT2/NOT3/NOT5 domain-containing protein, putative [Eimeria necatrix]|uniref:NOT2/NOT3/NOT5 domain-containing protein, putative n=1 Tax=Eimeria necatrix TaxID=51315 RepID=U6N055_9EIME|nr:NOT2/NOT3/NOT5 domain-containing protein, putative [Eimeria necatrix]CDJ68124.1 NOT2/NOT3/NOT5 domain-containing protein, putative [Eimeria necatrix]
MAEKRRLQQEVERTLRRVEEGCELFMDLYVKFKQQQTAKVEGELKKEIKKLQRLRESIKAWQTNVDVRDKGPLEDSRKKIEKCMETFRQCEKEIKTKAFSKEGLAAKTRDGEDRHREALQLLQQQLQREAALLEAEMDGLDSKKGKRDRERDREKKRISLLLQKHKQHITKLTEALRLADSSRLSPSAAAAIAVALQDFLSSNGDPAFVFDSSVYDCIAAEHSDSAEGSETEAADNNSDATLSVDTPASSSIEAASSSSTRGNRSTNSNKPTDSSSSSNRRALSVSEEPEGTMKRTSRRSSSPSNTSSSNSSKGRQQQQSQQGKGAAAATEGAAPSPSCWSSLPQQQGSQQSSPSAASLAEQRAASPATAANNRSNSSSGSSSSSSSKASEAGSVWKTGRLHAATAEQQRTQQLQGLGSPATGDKQQQQRSGVVGGGAAGVTVAPWKGKAAAAAAAGAAASPSAQATTGVAGTAGSGSSAKGQGKQQQQQQQQQQQRAAAESSSSTTNHGNAAATGAAPAEPQGVPSAGLSAAVAPQPPTNSIASDLSVVAAAVAASCYSRPLPQDTDFSSSPSPASPFFWPPWVPKGETMPPCIYLRAPWGPPGGPLGAPTGAAQVGKPPDCFPKGRLAAADERSFFRGLETDALFFAFYFQRGTVQQLHAARELKALSWRYHKKYQTWFQRLEEPRVSTDKYEQGAYVYFDYDNGWCSRIKHDFTFEYIYLEDELQE